VTEWSLQRTLTNRWLANQPTALAGEPLLLVAWEVMTDYRINDAHSHLSWLCCVERNTAVQLGIRGSP